MHTGASEQGDVGGTLYSPSLKCVPPKRYKPLKMYPPHIFIYNFLRPPKFV